MSKVLCETEEWEYLGVSLERNAMQSDLYIFQCAVADRKIAGQFSSASILPLHIWRQHTET